MKLNVLMVKLLLITLVVSSCKEQIPILSECVLPSEQEQSQKSEQSEDEVAPRVCNELTPNEESNLEVNALLRDFSIEKEEKMLKAIRRLQLVVNSEEFKKRVLNHEYEGAKAFIDSNGLTNEEIYESLISASETLLPEEANDNEIDVDITLYYSNNSTVGYTYPNVIGIWVNDKFFSSYTLGKVAANVVHEWTHKLGYGHDFNRTTRRKFSVPYGIGSIVEEMIDSL